MNGFERELRENLLNVVPHGELFTASGQGIVPTEAFLQAMRKDEQVEYVFTLNKGSGLLQKGKQVKSVELMGIEQDYYQEKFANHFDYDVFLGQDNGVVLGAKIMADMGLAIGDSVQILLPKVTEDMSFQTSVATWLTVLGEISIGGEIDSFIAITSKDTFSKMLDLDSTQGEVTHIELHFYDPFDAYAKIREYGWGFDQAVYMSDWTRTHGHLYQDINLVRVVIYIVLLLVICVASFNIVSSLVMSVREKSSEIAILKTIGASDAQIQKIFVVKGLYNGVIGASVGSVIGCLLAIYLSNILDGIESLLGFKILDAGIYFTSSIPSELSISDVIITYFIAIAISVLATLYPAYKASIVVPVAHLH